MTFFDKLKKGFYTIPYLFSIIVLFCNTAPTNIVIIPITDTAHPKTSNAISKNVFMLSPFMLFCFPFFIFAVFYKLKLTSQSLNSSLCAHTLGGGLAFISLIHCLHLACAEEACFFHEHSFLFFGHPLAIFSFL